jgi:tetratricopeptide (TPR) repeat protein
MGVKDDVAATLQNMGKLELVKGNLQKAEQHYREALTIQKAIGDGGGEAGSQVGLARIRIEQKEFVAARAELGSTLAEFQKDTDTDSEARVHALLARCFFGENNVGAAQQEIRAAQELAGHGGSKSLRYEVGITAARIEATQDPSDALEKLRDFESDARHTGMPGYGLEARLAIAQIEIARGKKALGQADLDTVKHEASAKGFGLIAQRASESASSIL